MTTHKLKCLPEFFRALLAGIKPFEVRRDDRGFQRGDHLQLEEWEPAHHEPTRPTPMVPAPMMATQRIPARYTGRTALFRVTYIFRGEGCAPGFCVMGVLHLTENLLAREHALKESIVRTPLPLAGEVMAPQAQWASHPLNRWRFEERLFSHWGSTPLDSCVPLSWDMPESARTWSLAPLLALTWEREYSFTLEGWRAWVALGVLFVMAGELYAWGKESWRGIMRRRASRTAKKGPAPCERCGDPAAFQCISIKGSEHLCRSCKQDWEREIAE